MLPLFERHERHFNMYEIYDCPFEWPMHLHAEAEFIYQMEGSIGIYLDKEEIILREGDAALIFCDVLHGYFPVNQLPTKEMMIIFHTEDVTNELNRMLHCVSANPVIRREDMHPDTRYVLDVICSEWRQDISDLTASSLISLGLSRCLDRMPLEPRSVGANSLVRRFINYISDNYQNPLTLEQTAQALNVNKYHLSHMLSERMHTNFREDLNRFRIEKAQLIMQSSSSAFSEILTACGFENPRTFSRAFYACTGMSPSQYRKMVKG